MGSDHLQQFLAEIEERICTCGAGHGSGEGHTDWCEWVEEYSCYERRILSALTAGKPEQECATEGCDKPATDYFERGGVGSHYCHGCYVKVQAVTTPPTAGGDDE